MRILAVVAGALSLLVVASLSGCGDSSSSADGGSLPVDQCTNPSDLGIIASLAAQLDGGIPDGGVPDGGPYPYSYMMGFRVAIETCADTMCIGAILAENGAEECMSNCLATTDAAGLSKECIACQNEVIRCGAAYCINVCLGSDQALCDECGLLHCGARLVECTGLPQELP